MITWVSGYRIDWAPQADFEVDWNVVGLIPDVGENHHGHFLPSEEHSDVAPGLFWFRSGPHGVGQSRLTGALSADR